MSVINQMLKDLEKRSEKKLNSIPKKDFIFLQGQEKTRSIWYFGLVLLVLALILAVIDGWVIFHRSKTPAKHTAPIAAHLVTKIPITNSRAVSLPLPKPSQLTAITLDQNKSLIQLRFLLSHPIFYRIAMDAKTRTYIITLENTLRATDLPAVNTLGDAITSMRMKEQPDKSLQILLQLKPGAYLQQAGLFAGSEFQVNLVYLPTVVQGIPRPPVLSKVAVPNSFTQQSFQTALKLLAEGEKEKAIVLLRSIVSLSPEFHPARESLVRELMQNGDMLEAESILLSAIKRYTKWLPYVNLQARWLVKQNKLNEALALMNQYTPALEKHPNYYAFMAALYQRQNQAEMAATLYQQLLAVQPHQAKWWLGYAIALDSLDRHAEAIGGYTHALNEQDSGLSPALKAWIQTRLQSV